MTEAATLCHIWGYTLHSGGANGADTAFEDTYTLLDGKMRIFHPWPGFNGRTGIYTGPKPEAFEIAETVHPAWNRLTTKAKQLIARNMHQILGWSLQDPVEFVLCYTPDGCESRAAYGKETGGTGAAIAIADRAGVPVFNLYNPNRFEEWIEFMTERQK
jgi:hypothetical protein